MHTLSVCRTCPRHLSEKGGLPERVRELAETDQSPDGLRILVVECLGGCRQPSAAVFDAPDKWRIRLTGLAAADAVDLMVAARTYAASPDGDLADEALPLGLRGRVSARSPKHPNRAAAFAIAADQAEKDTPPRFERLPRRTQ